MYETRFGLHRKPFQAVLTADDFFESQGYADLSSTVIHALRSDLGVAVLTGPSGIGKTVTLDSIRRAMSAENQVMVLRGGTVSTGEDLLHALHRRLLPPPGRKFESTVARGTAAQAARWEVIERMQKVSDFWGPTIVLLDDAHLTQPDLFVELRALMEEEADGQRLLRVMIAGPLSLEEFLATPPLQDFSQRIRTHRFLEPLSSAEAVAYLTHQLNRVGGKTGELFETAAVERIVAAADGVPRCLDLLADESLMSAFRMQEDRVSVTAVDDGLSRLRHLPYAWNVSLYSAASEADSDTSDAPTTTAIVSHGVIEVGAPAPAPASADHSAPADVSPVAARHQRPEVPEPPDSHDGDRGMIEIGAAEPVESVTSMSSDGGPEPVPTESSVDPEARFDRIFQAISMAGGSVAVAPVAGKSGREVTTAGPEAGSQADGVEATDVDSGDASAVIEIGSVSEDGPFCQDADAPDVADAVSLEHHMVLPSTDEPESPSGGVCVPALDAYRPWQPAGTWRSRVPTIAQTPTSAQTPAAARVTAAASTRDRLDVSAANASPVFDRYTWCELGRTVSPEPVNRSQLLLLPEATPVWPPVVSGVAPVDAIALQTIAADGTVVETDNLSMVATLPDVEVTERRLAGAVDPAESITLIQDMLQQGDDVAAEQTEPTVDDPDAAARMDGLLTLPMDLTGPASGRPLTADEVRRTDVASERTTDEGPQARLLREDQRESILIASVEEPDTAEEESEEGLQVYVGEQVARQTRQSVVSLAADQLRMAAGAESLCETPQRAVLDVTSGQVTVEQTEQSAGQGRFSSLFTRLRRGRRR